MAREKGRKRERKGEEATTPTTVVPIAYINCIVLILIILML